MYYYRKLYTDVIVDKAGSPIRILNDAGINYKLAKLPTQIQKKVEQTRNYLLLALSNEDLFNKMRESDVNTEVWYDYDSFIRRYDYLTKDVDSSEILKRYAEFKLVYEDRFFPYIPVGDDSDSDFPPIDLLGDYERFLVPSIFSVSRSDYRLDLFLENDCKGYMAYSQHPYFLRYIGFFTVLDLCADYFFIQGDNIKQKDAEERAATRRFHSQDKLKEFYSHFKC